MFRHYCFAAFIILAILMLLSACGSGAAAEPSPLPPTSTSVPPTPTSTPITSQAPFPTPQGQALEEAFAFVKQNYGLDLSLTEISYVTANGQDDVTLMVKVKCAGDNCASGKVYQWVLVSIAPLKDMPKNLARFHIEVQEQEGGLREVVEGKWSDLIALREKRITMAQLTRMLVFPVFPR